MQTRKTTAERPTNEAQAARQHLADAGYLLREAIAKLNLLPSSKRTDALGHEARRIEEAIVALERRI